MSPSDQVTAIPLAGKLPYRPQHPGLAWRRGASARRACVSYDDCPYTQRGKCWEWQAGWEYQDVVLGRRDVA